MKAYFSLIVREWHEWRTVMMVVGILYVLGLVLATVAFHKGSDALIRDRIQWNWDQDEWHLDDEGDHEWFSPKELRGIGGSRMLFLGWTHLLRVGMSFINLALLVLALFYLADVVYKERADGSTFFYRGLPVGDLSILSSKLLVGTVGFLVLSFILGVVWVLYAQITFPGSMADELAQAGLSPFQVASLDLIGDWSVFHLLQLAWLLPFAAYFMFVSTVTRSRPLLVGVGVPLLLGLLWRFLVGDNALLRELTANLGVIGEILKAEWLETTDIASGEPIELFGSFSHYILSLRTVISLLIAGGFFGLTFFAYRKNLPVS
ncbi:MAG: hypothetical protein ACETWG_11915 [Candidatus Neomarinimicrobiota bacterium]